MNELRPINTEFWIDIGADPFSTPVMATRIKYRVIAHVEVYDFPHPNAPTHVAEEVKAIEIEKYYPYD
jgi:hypothetical protein